MESSFAQAGIRLVFHPGAHCIPEIEDVLYLLRLVKAPSRYDELVPRFQDYARNTNLVAAAVAVELLHCSGCHGDLAAARVTIAKAIVNLTAEEDRCLLNVPMVAALALATGESIDFTNLTYARRRERCHCKSCRHYLATRAQVKAIGTPVPHDSNCCLDH